MRKGLLDFALFMAAFVVFYFLFRYVIDAPAWAATMGAVFLAIWIAD